MIMTKILKVPQYLWYYGSSSTMQEHNAC